MQQILLILYVVVCLGLIVLVLLQHGKGADIGAAFGSGASQTVFGSQGSGSFLFRLTSVLGALFFALSLAFAIAVSSKPPTTAIQKLQQISEKNNVPLVGDFTKAQQKKTNK